jgi:pimeloyl-ACP methyl ester carboxylesterase
MRSHIAMRRLAALLARAGFHVLRFDYYGTGDSAGDARHGSLSEWRENIVAAAHDISECSGARSISVVGFRLGASLAASAPMTMDTLVLWDPVVNGSRYLEELRATHSRQFSGLLFPPPLPAPGVGGDLLGHPLPGAMEKELRAIDLLAQGSDRAARIALVVSEQRPEYAQLLARLGKRASGEATLDYCPAVVESQANQADAMLVSGSVLQTLTSVLVRRAS